MNESFDKIRCLFQNNLDSDEDFFEKKCPDNTGKGTEDSRVSSTGGCFESIRRWISGKVNRLQTGEGESTAIVECNRSAACDGDSPATVEGDSTDSGKGNSGT